MRVQRDNDRISPLGFRAKIFDLIRVNICGLILNSLRQIDYRLIIRRRLPALEDTVADLNRKVELGI